MTSPEAASGADGKESGSSEPLFVVGIGASAGGLEAIEPLLRGLPPDEGLAVVIVQHLSRTHVSRLPEIYARFTAMPVAEVVDEPVVQPNRVYVIPPDRGMVITEGALRLHALQERGRNYRPIDEFFTSLAHERRHRAIGVVLSGSGTDGTAGLQAIKAEGGITFAQDFSAQQEGMPRSAIASGSVDFILAPEEVAAEIARIARHPLVSAGQRAREQRDEQAVERAIALLRQHTGVDFAAYKATTLSRRLARRAVLLKMEDLAQYVAHLQHTPQEVDALYQDLLINVTSFFRASEGYDAVRAKALPRLLQGRARDDPLRAWVIGCSTGEEAYSLAMTLAEQLDDAGTALPVQIYATDINAASIDHARAGFYSRAIARDVSPTRLRRFFVEADGGYRVSKAIRDMCVFARHNVLVDPPFSRMDLVSCRNVLIYIDPRAQRKLVSVLHYALKPSGFLLLGASETIGSLRDLFDVEDGKAKLYAKRARTTRLDGTFLAAPVAEPTPSVQPRMERNMRAAQRDAQADVIREAERMLMSHYAPAGVLVDGELNILQFRGDTSPYLAPAPGKASLNLLKMVREGLLVPVRTVVNRARKENAVAREACVQVKSAAGLREMDIVAIPVKENNARDRSYLLMFEERGAARDHPDAGAAAPLPSEGGEVARLTRELAATREYLQSVIEQQEAANEELQSANEEVQSANEELQSINEELETSKEEIQSSNEELITVNEELQTRNEELNRANNDLNNLLASVQMPIVMVWQDLRIRRFTPAAESLLNLIPGDVGRPIGDIKLDLDGTDLATLAQEVIDTVSIRESEVRDRTGRWYSLRVRPYRTLDNRIDGAVIVLIDIDDLRRTHEESDWRALILERALEPIFVRKPDGEIVYWNRGAELLYGYPKDEAVGRFSQHLLGGRDDWAAVESALTRDGRWSGELGHLTKGGRSLVVESTMTVVQDRDRSLVIETNRDVTGRKELEEALRRRVSDLAQADVHKNEFLMMLAHELRNPLAPMRNALEVAKAQGPAAQVDGRLTELLDRQVGRMARIVDDLFDAARVSRGTVELRMAPIVLQEVLRHAVDAVQAEAAAHQIEIGLDVAAEPVLLRGDAMRLEQVFENLVGNAVKFTPDGGRVRIVLGNEPAATDGRPEAVVRVTDTGIGIAPDVLPTIFDLFVQAGGSGGRARGGLGIGLNLVRNLVERHGGRVAARSDGLGRGSEFVVRLPLPDGESGRGGRAQARTD